MSNDVLQIDSDDRYSRFRLIAWWDQDKLRASKVLVVGAGALGNEVLKNLAMLGVGTIQIVDFDKIEKSNLTRSVLFRSRDCGRSKAKVAAEALRDMNSEADVQPLDGNIITDVGLGVFAQADVVIGCLDNREARLWVNRSCWKVGTPWIDGGIQEINGVVKIFVPPGDACYECAMTENDYRLINLRYSCPLLRQEDLLAGKVPTAPTIASMIAGLQTQEALKLIHAMPVDAGHAMVFNGVVNHFYTTRYQRKENCLSHETWPTPIDLSMSADANTAGELLAAAAEHLQSDVGLTLHLARDLVVSIDCDACHTSRPIMKARPSVGMSQSKCEVCGEFARPVMVHTVASDSPLVDEPMIRLGIPRHDIVCVSTDDHDGLFRLAADEGSIAQKSSNS